jgi:hypothetical protein
MMRLTSASEELSRLYGVASVERRRKAALVACEAAVKNAKVQAPEVEEALAVLRKGRGPVPEGLQARLERLAERLDDEYFQRSESEEPSARAEGLALFSQARAVSALMFAVSGESVSLHEALYEALATTAVPEEMVPLLADALGAGPAQA